MIFKYTTNVLQRILKIRNIYTRQIKVFFYIRCRVCIFVVKMDFLQRKKNMFCVNPTARTPSYITKNNGTSADYTYSFFFSKWILSNWWQLHILAPRAHTHGQVVWCRFQICCLHIISTYCQILRSLKYFFLLIVRYGNSFFFPMFWNEMFLLLLFFFISYGNAWHRYCVCFCVTRSQSKSTFAFFSHVIRAACLVLRCCYSRCRRAALCCSISYGKHTLNSMFTSFRENMQHDCEMLH